MAGTKDKKSGFVDPFAADKPPTPEELAILNGPPNVEQLLLAKKFGLSASDMKALQKTVAESGGTATRDTSYDELLGKLGSIDTLLAPASGPIDSTVNFFGGNVTRADKFFGGIDQNLLSNTFLEGGDSKSANAAMGNLTAKAFTENVAKLKGFGALSNAEGEKIAAAANTLFASTGKKDDGSLTYSIDQAGADEQLKIIRDQTINSMWRIQNGIVIDPATNKILENPNNAPEKPTDAFKKDPSTPIVNNAPAPVATPAPVPPPEPTVADIAPALAADAAAGEVDPFADPAAAPASVEAPLADPAAVAVPVAPTDPAAPVELFSLGKEGAAAAWAAAPSGTTFTFKGEVKVKP